MRPLPRLLAFTDDAICARDDFPIRVAAILSAGSAVAVVVRAPAASADLRRRYLERVRALARPTEAATIVAGDPALGRLVGVQGVQLEGAGPGPRAARDLLGPGWIGVAVGSPEDADRAAAEGADYLVADRGPGVDWLRAVVARGTPVFAAGCLDRDEVSAVAAAGVWGIAVTEAIWTAVDPARAVVELLGALPNLE